MISKAQEKKLVLKAYSGCVDAEKQLLSANLQYIKNMAKVIYTGKNSVQYNDLVQEGCLEFVKGLRRKSFDISKGCRLIGFFKRSIIRQMRAAKNRFHLTHDIPRYSVEIQTVVHNVIEEYTKKHHCKPNIEYIEKFLQFHSKDRVKYAISCHNSVDVEFMEAEVSPLYDTEFEENIEDVVSSKQRLEKIKASISNLKPKYRLIMEQLFFNPEEPNFTDLGLKLNISKQRVQQIYKLSVSQIQQQLGEAVA